MAQPLPSGVVTFVMTDVEGSHRLWDAEPDAMSLALADHGCFMSLVWRW